MDLTELEWNMVRTLVANAIEECEDEDIEDGAMANLVVLSEKLGPRTDTDPWGDDPTWDAP